MATWYRSQAYFDGKLDNEFQYSTNVAMPRSVYSVISDFNYCQYSQCDANNEVMMEMERDSQPIRTSALLMDDGCKSLIQEITTCFSVFTLLLFFNQ